MFTRVRNSTKQSAVLLSIVAVVYTGNAICDFLDNDSYRRPIGAPGNFAGSESCAGCHAAIYKSHIQTAHYADSRPARAEFIKGSFEQGKNRFVYNQWMYVLLEKKNKKLFQTAYINEIPTQSAPFDIVIGSGRKGQTYLYWDGDMLYQLPVSYFTLQDKWCNSPGYSSRFIRFDRIIPAQCLECHSTYIKVIEDQDNISSFDKSTIIYGIDCERCHGPAAEHVSFHQANPSEKQARFITGTQQLTRQQRLDACAICHSGFRKQVKQPFTYQTGDELEKHSIASFTGENSATLDVHGNQYGLLTASQCFIKSQMDCSSCHNVHINEVNQPALFSQRCIACHGETTHPVLAPAFEDIRALEKNCVDCHMPMLPSKNIVLNVADASELVPDTVRTHRIAIYPERTQAILTMMKEK